MCIWFVYTLLKAVDHYDLSVSVHISDGFPKKKVFYKDG